jgi:hypothetical protein
VNVSSKWEINFGVDVAHNKHRSLMTVATLEFIQHHLPKIGHGNLL